MAVNKEAFYKGGKVIFALGQTSGQVAEIEILVDGGPLCVGPVWNWSAREKVAGLYFIYFKSHGLHFGPYYASLVLAERDMKKVLHAFPQKSFWEQKLEWYGRQDAFHDWVEKNMGKPDDLMGGEWVAEDSKTKT